MAAATVVGVLATGATAAHAAPEGTDQPATATVTFLSPEQYEQQWGVPSTVPPKVSELADEARVTVATSDRQASGAAPAIEMDPGGGKPAEWWIILKEYRDRSNRTVPVRLGNGALGYNHYAVRHNLRSFAPLEATLPLLVTASPGGPTVRGIVRADDGHTRIALWAGDAGPGVAAEFALESLADNGEVLRAEAAVDHVRTVLTADFERHRSNPSLTRDSHHNAIVPVSPAEIAALAGRVGPEHGLARLFAMLAYGGDPPWFAEVFTFTGFML
ncbi:hypothetical protein ABT214_02985 [Micromonospora purpureochromogenes]|uniref:hypothetical protein n=1 Tax=Micromonospora purpureochromogenes TaxID=47872 RepID=UPI00331CF3AF